MSKRVLLEAFGLQRKYRIIDPMQPDKLILEDQFEVEPYLEMAKMLSEQEPGKEIRHAAVIPKHVLRQAFQEGWFNDQQAWKRWANDPDNKLFRTWPGAL